MKAIQVLFDERLLSELDSDQEVKQKGRSAVLRKAASDYLGRRRREAIANQYRQAYQPDSGLGPEFQGWEGEGKWPGD